MSKSNVSSVHRETPMNITSSRHVGLGFSSLSTKAGTSGLPPDLNNYDVLCGRSKFSYHHVGNHRFRVTISIFLQQYIDNTNRAYRSCLFERISQLMNDCGGRFWKLQDNKWVSLNVSMARHKISHALRDAAALQTSKVPVSRTGKRLHQEEQEKKRKRLLEQSEDKSTTAPSLKRVVSLEHREDCVPNAVKSTCSSACTSHANDHEPEPLVLKSRIGHLEELLVASHKKRDGSATTMKEARVLNHSVEVWQPRDHIGVVDKNRGVGTCQIKLQDWNLVCHCLNSATA